MSSDKNREDAAWPVRLKSETNEAATVLKEYAQSTSRTRQEEGAYGRVTARLEGRRPRVARAVALASMAAGAALLFWFSMSGREVAPPSTPAAAVALAPPPASPHVPVLNLDARPVALPTGKLHLPGEVIVTVAESSSAPPVWSRPRWRSRLPTELSSCRCGPEQPGRPSWPLRKASVLRSLVRHSRCHTGRAEWT